MPVNDMLGTRMKENYEMISRTKLMKRTPVAIRIDGKAFHTFTKGFQKPFDRNLMSAMQETMRYLCENIQGCVLGYTQSDEITLILIDYKKLDSSAWFGYEVQKISSIAASMATMAFNKFFSAEVAKDKTSTKEQLAIYTKAIEKGAMFDARCFNIPKEEVTNLVFWRQLDATRNSIQMVCQAHFTPAELHKKSCNEMVVVLREEKGIDWENYPIDCKRGSACIYEVLEQCSGWIIDRSMPCLRDEGREYVDKLIEF